jgi:hypothetical protein
MLTVGAAMPTLNGIAGAAPADAAVARETIAAAKNTITRIERAGFMFL